MPRHHGGQRIWDGRFSRLGIRSPAASAIGSITGGTRTTPRDGNGASQKFKWLAPGYQSCRLFPHRSRLSNTQNTLGVTGAGLHRRPRIDPSPPPPGMDHKQPLVSASFSMRSPHIYQPSRSGSSPDGAGSSFANRVGSPSNEPATKPRQPLPR